jgi:hypothetical protein
VGVGGEWGEGSAAKRRSLRVGSPNDRQFSTRCGGRALGARRLGLFIYLR